MKLKFLYEKYWELILTTILMLVYSSGYANPAATDTISAVMCNITVAVTGPVAQGISTIVIVVTGYSFFVGKVSAGMLFVVAGGVILIFGAETITGWMMGADLAACTKSDIG